MDEPQAPDDERRCPALRLDCAALTEWIQPLWPGRRVVAADLLGGGFVNTNYRVRVSGAAVPYVIRVFVRDPAACSREAGLIRLVRNAVPVPEVLYAEPNDAQFGHTYAILEWIEGVKLHAALAVAGPADLPGLGRSLGEALARIGRHRFPAAGFLGPDLSVAEPFDDPVEAYLSYARQCLDDQAGARLGPALAGRVRELLSARGGALDAARRHRSLVHSDFKAANLLVRRTHGLYQTAAVLDWEFSHSGSPLLDLAIFCREDDRWPPGFEAGFVQGFRAEGGELPTGWKQAVRVLDLANLCEFLNGPAERQAALAHDRILRTLRERDAAGDGADV